MLRWSIFSSCSSDRRREVLKPTRTKQVGPIYCERKTPRSVLLDRADISSDLPTHPQTFSVKQLSNPLTSSLTHSNTLNHAPTSDSPSPLPISSSKTFSSHAILTNFFIPTSNSLIVSSKLGPIWLTKIGFVEIFERCGKREEKGSCNSP